MTPGRYKTPGAFKQALEQRLRSTSASGVDFARRRQLLVFERFLARLSQEIGDGAVLKGGLVLELRLKRARTTKDVDLRIMGTQSDVLERLQDAGRLALGDFLRFEVKPDPRHPDIQNEGMRYEGHRFRTECFLAGRIYGAPFGVDVAFGDPIIGEPETLVTESLLEFAGIAPTRLRVYPTVSHIAEKLHAYTLPRQRPNTRVKDLPDLVLLSTVEPFEAAKLREALRRTFSFRGTHAVPTALAVPPDSWTSPYERIAKADGLAWPNLTSVYKAGAAFLDPVLSGQTVRHWDHEVAMWLE